MLLASLVGLAASAMGADAPRGTVVCVHGFLRSRANHWAVAAKLRPTWRVVNWAYPSRARTIEGHAAALVVELRRQAAAHPGEPIHFVTHSLGGLILRAALNRPDCPPEARQGRAVLMAPPNRGAIVARRLVSIAPVRWVFGRYAGQQLMTTPTDGFARLGEFPPTVEVLVIAGRAGCNPLIPGPDDGKVAVAETPLATPHAFATLRAGHSWLAWSPTALRMTRDFLALPHSPALPVVAR